MGGGGGGQQQAPQPQPENPTIKADRDQVSTNQAALTTANTAYTKAVSAFMTEYKKKDEYVAARKALEQAQKDLDAARGDVLAKLKTSNADYQSAVAKETAAKKKLDSIRASGGTRDAISAQSDVILKAGDVVAKVEGAAYDADATCVDDRKKLADAKAAVDELDAKMAEAVKADENLISLKTTKDAAQTALDDSKKKLSTDVATLK